MKIYELTTMNRQPLELLEKGEIKWNYMNYQKQDEN